MSKRGHLLTNFIGIFFSALPQLFGWIERPQQDVALTLTAQHCFLPTGY